jgi:hypothetical protein
LPSRVATVASLQPLIRSGAPHSSTAMCAVSAQITASKGFASALIASTFAPVPLKTTWAAACAPKWRRKHAVIDSVHGSSP